MINSLGSDKLTELCEEFLHDHEGAVKSTILFGKKFGLDISRDDVKNCMMQMQLNGEFDEVVCYGIELGSNNLYKRFHPS